MRDLLENEWIQGPQANSSTPLMTPKLLSFRQPRVESGVKATMKAFHKAHREGFRLMDVSHAPLAKRRKLKKDSSTETRSSSSESIHSPGSSQGRTTPTQQQQQFINPNARTSTGTDGAVNPIVVPSLQQVKQVQSTDSIGFSPVLPPLGTPDMTTAATQAAASTTTNSTNTAAAEAAAAVVLAAAATAAAKPNVNATTIGTNNNNTVTIVKGVAPTATGQCCITQQPQPHAAPISFVQLQQQQPQQQQQNIATAYAIPSRLTPFTVPLLATQQQYAPTHVTLAPLQTIQENTAVTTWQVAPGGQLLMQSVPTTQSTSKATSKR